MEAGQTFNRARSIIERRAPLKRVLTNESVLEGGKDKNAAWKLIIIQTDSQRHSKMTLERYSSTFQILLRQADGQKGTLEQARRTRLATPSSNVEVREWLVAR